MLGVGRFQRSQGFLGTMGGGLGAASAEPWQMVLQAFQRQNSFNPQIAVTVSPWAEAKTGRLPQVT